MESQNTEESEKQHEERLTEMQGETQLETAEEIQVSEEETLKEAARAQREKAIAERDERANVNKHLKSGLAASVDVLKNSVGSAERTLAMRKIQEAVAWLAEDTKNIFNQN